MASAGKVIGIPVDGRMRERANWRAGRPEEDPEKTKPWGFVTAKPSEYLVHCRRGRVLGRSSGQGASCFKWPRDSVAIVPTSLQRVQFTADQVSLERVGVEVTGLAVYRIAEPLIAYRVLNFSYPERAQEKLEETLVSMLVGATRRLVANLTVDECFRKRKHALADELLRELAPVLGGTGHPSDGTDRGWGVVLDTVEIQEVRVLSENVFTSMQAPFRARLEQEAREARADAERAGALREIAAKREVETAQVDAGAELRSRRSEVERTQQEETVRNVLHRQQLELERQRVEARDAVEVQRLAAEQAQAELEAFEVRSQAQARAAELERARWGADLERRQAEATQEAVEGQATATVALAHAKARREEAEAEARVTLAEKLPELAAAVGQRFGEVKITQIGGDASPFGSIAQAVAAVVDLVKQH